jgi:tetratricopeptide (TPR) repeat protein
MRSRKIYEKLLQVGVSVLVVVVVLIIGTAIGAIGAHSLAWLVPVAAVIAALVPLIASQIAAADLRRDHVAEFIHRHLRSAPETGKGEIPTVSDLTLEDLGVYRAVLTVPYIRRDCEPKIRNLLESGSPVLLVGSSMVGKTMTAATIIKDLYSQRKIVFPDSKDTLASLDSIENMLSDTVIWLDDINRYIGAGGITPDALQRLTDKGNAVIATIRARAYNRYMPSSDVKSPEWDVLKTFERVFLDRELSTAEKERVADALGDDITVARISSVGLGEYVGAAELIDESLKLGPSVSPAGYALVLGAADWRRVGIDRPIPGSLLPLLATPHLGGRRFQAIASDTYAAALAWATHEINEEVSLLRQVGDDSFAIFDYALDLISAKSDCLPETTWEIVISAATPAELLSVGYTAWVTYGIFETAFAAWRLAIESGDAIVWPRAAYNIAHILEHEGRPDDARVFYERAIASEDQEIAAVALSDLGYMRFKDGQTDEAKHIYGRVLDEIEDRWAVTLTYLRLGLLSEMQGETSEARDWYDRVSRSGYYNLVPHAEIGLAHIDLLENDPLSARSHFQKAINSGHPQHAPMAAFELANVLIRYDQTREAYTALRIATEIWNDEVSPVAAGMLGQLLEADGEIEAAHAAYTTAAKSGHASAAPTAAFFLGKILEQRGDRNGALNSYRKALTCAIEEISAEASASIKRLTGELPVLANDSDYDLGWREARASSQPCWLLWHRPIYRSFV